MRHFVHTLAVALVLPLSGCSGLGTKTFEEFNINDGTSVSLDATQRVIIVKEIPGDRIVCAEPSPDAVVAAAVQAAAKADVPNTGTARISGGFSQQASSIGIRTATIQLLRDGYFRACEATMNDLLDWESYRLILNGITPVMVGLVAIDGLTQMGPAPVVTVSASGSASTGADTTTTTTTTGVSSGSGDQSRQVEVASVATQVVQIVEMVLKSHDARMEKIDEMMTKGK